MGGHFSARSFGQALFRAQFCAIYFQRGVLGDTISRAVFEIPTLNQIAFHDFGRENLFVDARAVSRRAELLLAADASLRGARKFFFACAVRGKAYPVG